MGVNQTRLLRYMAGIGIICQASMAVAVDETKLALKALSIQSCLQWQSTRELTDIESVTAIAKSPIIMRDREIGTRFRLALTGSSYFEVDVIEPQGQLARFIGKYFINPDLPSLRFALGLDCDIRDARQINYDEQQKALKITQLDASLTVFGEAVLLNPPIEWQPRGGDSRPDAPRVAMVDSGVNYLLPEINHRLARDSNGELIGYDFWNMDRQPYDVHPGRSPFFIQRHGTRTASLLLREAPDIELVPYRYPRPDMSRMRLLVEHANRNKVEILGMPLGSNREQDWLAFEQAARAHPNLLFIVSAGNNGRDIDTHPVYPAALDLDNMIVVTSADDFVRPAERTNWGKISVDYLLPAEAIVLTDFNGESIRASGSSYAVARMTALAARIKQNNRGWSVAQIKNELRRIAALNAAQTLRWVKVGYIADPLIGEAIDTQIMPAIVIEQILDKFPYRLDLDIIQLDPEWSKRRIQQALQQAYEVLAQCGIGTGTVTFQVVSGADYLRDLSTGSAHTLFSAIDAKRLKVVLARDTHMLEAFDGEAFGAGNTGNRPWLRDSVWLMPTIENDGIALAHELFHVIANNGEHVDIENNLMQSRTQSNNIDLTDAQCQLAQTTGVRRGLLINRVD